MKLFTICLLISLNLLIASSTEWDEKEKQTKIKNSEVIFVGFVEKVVFISKKGEMLKEEEFIFHLAMQDYIQRMINLKFAHKGRIDLMPNDEKLQDKLNLVLEETKKKRSLNKVLRKQIE